MAKNAVFSQTIPFQFNSNQELKRLSLLFDKIYIKKPAIPQLQPYEVIDTNIAEEESVKSLYNELKVFEYLHANNIIEEYTCTPLLKNPLLSIDETNYIDSYFNKLDEAVNAGQIKDFFENNFEENYLTTLSIEDIESRINALELSKKFNSEFYPVLKSDKFFEEKEKKREIIHFVLSNIPEPDENTPWEAIIDFRKDDDVRNKYLKLISWINNIAISNLSANDIKDEYEHLYSDYIRAYKLHNIKYRNSLLEVLIPAGAALLIGEPFSGLKLASEYISMKLKSVSILEEEGKLPGNEIAYIYKVNQKLKP